jgi:hypothetical protein
MFSSQKNFLNYHCIHRYTNLTVYLHAHARTREHTRAHVYSGYALCATQSPATLPCVSEQRPSPPTRTLTITRPSGGPLFNPFETLTPDLIREKNLERHMQTLPDESEVATPDSFENLMFDFYPSPVDLPTFKPTTLMIAEHFRLKMEKRLAVANAAFEYDAIVHRYNYPDERSDEMAKNNGWDFTNPNDDSDAQDAARNWAKNNQDPNAEEIPADIWVPDRALQSIEMERQFDETLSDTALAQKILKQNLPLVAVGITHTAKYASDQRLRFQAQTYVMDRVLGKVGTSVVNDDSPLDELNKQLMELVAAAVEGEI